MTRCGYKRGYVDLQLRVHPDTRDGIRRAARDLGYPNTAFYVRCLLNAELRSPRMPEARNLVGRRTPREISLSRPRRYDVAPDRTAPLRQK